MTKHVLCAVDLTHADDARRILKEANGLAGYYGAALSVVTVVPDYGTAFVGSFFEEGTLKKAIDAANAALHRLVDEVLPGHEKVQHIVECGNVYEEILHAIDECDADLVVIGAHKPDLVDRLQGPNSARVARYAKVSVLVLRMPS